MTQRFKQLVAGLCLAAASMLAYADEGDAPWWKKYQEKAETIYDQGDLSLLVAGHTHHGRNTYTKERIAELNENTWGLGFLKSVRDKKDNEESLYALLISDSHYQPQAMAGYAYQWMKPLGNDWEAGLGVTGLLISRQDYFKGFPFPVVLPVASIGTKNTKLMASYVPRLSQNKGNGDVLFVFVRFSLN